MPQRILSSSFVVCFLAPLHLIEIYKTCLFGAFFLPCFQLWLMLSGLVCSLMCALVVLIARVLSLVCLCIFDYLTRSRPHPEDHTDE